MSKCEQCKHAVWDYEEYVGGARQWFVSDCRRDRAEPSEECDDYEEGGQ